MVSSPLPSPVSLEASSNRTKRIGEEHSSERYAALLRAHEQVLGGRAVVLYDGVCGLCNRVVGFLLRQDRNNRLLFTPLETELARALIARYPTLPQTAEGAQSVIVMLNVLTLRESVHQRSDAVLAGMGLLSAPWSVAAALLRLVPRGIRDAGYCMIARLRYRLFGRLAACPIPTAEQRSRILGIEQT